MTVNRGENGKHSEGIPGPWQGITYSMRKIDKGITELMWSKCTEHSFQDTICVDFQHLLQQILLQILVKG